MSQLDIRDIRDVLIRFGSAKLTKIFGDDARLEAIFAIMGGSVTESQIADIIVAKYGSRIFVDKKLRNLIIKALKKSEMLFLLSCKNNVSLDRNALIKKLQNFSWTKYDAIANRWLDLFGLDQSIFISVKEKLESKEIVLPDAILYPYQKKIKDRLVRLLINNTNRILVHMPTGAGKTRTIIEALVDYWRVQGNNDGYLIWLADSEELCVQAEETFKKLWVVRGDRQIELIRLWGKHNIKELEKRNGLIIASFQKLHSLQRSTSDEKFNIINEIRSRNRLTIVDEAHKSIAPTYIKIIEFLCDLERTKLIGLTATPGRNNKEQIQELVKLYGDNKITLTDEQGKDIEDPIRFLQNESYLSKIKRKEIATNVVVDLTPKEIKNLGEFFEIPIRVLAELSKDKQRNILILKEIADLHDKNHQIIVFACSVEHAHLIAELLMIKDIPAKCVVGSTPSNDREKYIEEFKKGSIRVLVNYGVLTTGFDAPKTNAIVITRPTGSLVLYSQMIGRGIRGPKMGGTEDCFLIDLKDNLEGYPSEKQAFNFFNTYWKNGDK